MPLSPLQVAFSGLSCFSDLECSSICSVGTAVLQYTDHMYVLVQTGGLTEEDTQILLEKEFDDYYEDRAHKSAGPVVFLSKCLGMLPVIWTDDDAESDCKSYFNLYTFVVFLAWIGQQQSV